MLQSDTFPMRLFSTYDNLTALHNAQKDRTLATRLLPNSSPKTGVSTLELSLL